MKTTKLSGGYGPVKGSSGDRLAIEKKSLTQTTGPAEGMSSPHWTPAGSGSRPVPSRFKIDSSAPIRPQRFRPSNKVGN
jgi:hypothetical protein